MSNATPSLQGQVDGAGAADALFYKVFTGEILTAFDEKNVMESRVRTRNVKNQKSASFANTGKAGGRIHTPGAEILGSQMKHNETVITVDDLIISDVFIADIYEAMNHYEVRGEYSKQMGAALARTFDKQALRVLAAAAGATNKITGLPGGTEHEVSSGYAAADDATKAAEFAEILFAAHQKFVENDVPAEDAVAIIRPADYFRLVRNKDLLNVDWGGLGSYANAELPMVGGINLVVSNHIPAQADAGSLNADGDTVDGLDVISSAYAADYTKLIGLITTRDAVGCVKLIDLSLQSEWDIRRQGTLMVARMATGFGVLRPECAQKIVAYTA